MENELKQLCQQLDEIIINFFQTLNQLLTSRQELESVMKDGFFQMARARYSMGANSVSSMQHNPADLEKALSHVSVTQSTDGCFSFEAALETSRIRSSAVGIIRDAKEVGLADDKGSECVELDQISCNEDAARRLRSDLIANAPLKLGLRKRNLLKDEGDKEISPLIANEETDFSDLISDIGRMTCEDEEWKETSAPSSSSPCPEEERLNETNRPGKDPLLWFGLLVPQPLRKSQMAFKRAIELSCQVATLQGQLLHKKMEYGDKIKQKHDLQSRLCALAATNSNHLQDPTDCAEVEVAKSD